MKASQKFTRRKWLTAFAAATSAVLSAPSAARSDQNGEMSVADKHQPFQTDQKNGMSVNPLVDRFSRRHTDIVLSSPPQTMGG